MNQSPCSKPSSQKKCWNSIADKLTAKEIYSILILSLRKSLTSQNYFENAFPNCTFVWTQIYLSLRTIKKLHLFGKIDSPLCFVCHSNHEPVMHLFCECVRVSQLWSPLRIFCSTDLDLPLLMPQTAVFGFLAETDKSILKITNHLLLIFKMY